MFLGAFIDRCAKSQFWNDNYERILEENKNFSFEDIVYQEYQTQLIEEDDWNFLLDQLKEEAAKNPYSASLKNDYMYRPIQKISDPGERAIRRARFEKTMRAIADFSGRFMYFGNEMKKNNLPKDRDSSSIMSMLTDKKGLDERIGILKSGDSDNIKNMFLEIIRKGENVMKSFQNTTDDYIADHAAELIDAMGMFLVIPAAVREMEKNYHVQFTDEEKEYCLNLDAAGEIFSDSANAAIHWLSNPYYCDYDTDNLNRMANISQDFVWSEMIERLMKRPSFEQRYREEVARRSALNPFYYQKNLSEHKKNEAIFLNESDLGNTSLNLARWETRKDFYNYALDSMLLGDSQSDLYYLMGDGTLLSALSTPAAGSVKCFEFSKLGYRMKTAQNDRSSIYFDAPGPRPDAQIAGPNWRNQIREIYNVLDKADRWFQSSSPEFSHIKESLELLLKPAAAESVDANYELILDVLDTCRAYFEKKKGKTLEPRQIARLNAVGAVAEELAHQIETYRIKPIREAMEEDKQKYGPGVADKVVSRRKFIFINEQKYRKVIPGFRFTKQQIEEYVDPVRLSELDTMRKSVTNNVYDKEEDTFLIKGADKIPAEFTCVGRLLKSGNEEAYHSLDAAGQEGINARANFILELLNLPNRLDWSLFRPESPSKDKLKFFNKLNELPLEGLEEVTVLMDDWGISLKNPEETFAMLGSLKTLNGLYASFRKTYELDYNTDVPLDFPTEEQYQMLLKGVGKSDIRIGEIENLMDFRKRLDSAVKAEVRPVELTAADLDLTDAVSVLPNVNPFGKIGEILKQDRQVFRNVFFDDPDVSPYVNQLDVMLAGLKDMFKDDIVPTTYATTYIGTYYGKMNELLNNVEKTFQKEEADPTGAKQSMVETIRRHMETYIKPERIRSLMMRNRLGRVMNLLEENGIAPNEVKFRDMDQNEFDLKEAAMRLTDGDSLSILGSNGQFLGTLIGETDDDIRFTQADFNEEFLRRDRETFAQLQNEYPERNLDEMKQNFMAGLTQQINEIKKYDETRDFRMTAYMTHKMLSADRIGTHLKAQNYVDVQKTSPEFWDYAGMLHNNDPYSRAKAFFVKAGNNPETIKENDRALGNFYRTGREGRQGQIDTALKVFNMLYEVDTKLFDENVSDQDRLAYIMDNRQLVAMLNSGMIMSELKASYGIEIVGEKEQKYKKMMDALSDLGVMVNNIDVQATEQYLTFPAEFIAGISKDALYQDLFTMPRYQNENGMIMNQAIHNAPKRMRQILDELKQFLEENPEPLTEKDLIITEPRVVFEPWLTYSMKLHDCLDDLQSQFVRLNPEAPNALTKGTDEYNFYYEARALMERNTIENPTAEDIESLKKISTLAQNMNTTLEKWSLVESADSNLGRRGLVGEAINYLANLHMDRVEISILQRRTEQIRSTLAKNHLNPDQLDFYFNRKPVPFAQFVQMTYAGRKCDMVSREDQTIYSMERPDQVVEIDERIDSFNSIAKSFRAFRAQFTEDKPYWGNCRFILEQCQELFAEGRTPTSLDYGMVVLLKSQAEGSLKFAKAAINEIADPVEKKHAMETYNSLQWFIEDKMAENVIVPAMKEAASEEIYRLITEKENVAPEELAFFDIDGNPIKKEEICAAVWGETLVVKKADGTELGIIDFDQNRKGSFDNKKPLRNLKEEYKAALEAVKRDFPDFDVDAFVAEKKAEYLANAEILKTKGDFRGLKVGNGLLQKAMNPDRIRCHMMSKKHLEILKKLGYDTKRLANNAQKYLPVGAEVPGAIRRFYFYGVVDKEGKNEVAANYNRIFDLGRFGRKGMEARQKFVMDMMNELFEIPEEFFEGKMTEAETLQLVLDHPMLKSHFENQNLIGSMKTGMGFEIVPHEMAEKLKTVSNSLATFFDKLEGRYTEDAFGTPYELMESRCLTNVGARMMNSHPSKEELQLSGKLTMGFYSDTRSVKKDFEELVEFRNQYGRLTKDNFVLSDEKADCNLLTPEILKKEVPEIEKLIPKKPEYSEVSSHFEEIKKVFAVPGIISKKQEEALCTHIKVINECLYAMEHKAKQTIPEHRLINAKLNRLSEYSTMMAYARFDKVQELFHKYGADVRNCSFVDEKGEKVSPLEMVDGLYAGKKFLFTAPSTVKNVGLKLDGMGEIGILLTPELEQKVKGIAVQKNQEKEHAAEKHQEQSAALNDKNSIVK